VTDDICRMFKSSHKRPKKWKTMYDSCINHSKNEKKRNQFPYPNCYYEFDFLVIIYNIRVFYSLVDYRNNILYGIKRVFTRSHEYINANYLHENNPCTYIDALGEILADTTLILRWTLRKLHITHDKRTIKHVLLHCYIL